MEETSSLLARRLREGGRVVVLTGAGVSAESGIPTFRDAQTGLWARFDPQELASPEGFARNPKLVWDWYRWRYGLVKEAQPNPAHRALAELERLLPDFWLITQNVDGLHRRAGSRRVIELHGDITRARCTRCSYKASLEELPGEGVPPCPRCGAPMRPDVVWFGEPLPEEALSQAWALAQTAEVFLSIGTSAVVFPAAHLPVLAKERGAFLVEVNPEPTPVSEMADLVVRERAGKFLPEVLNALKAG